MRCSRHSSRRRIVPVVIVLNVFRKKLRPNSTTVSVVYSSSVEPTFAYPRLVIIMSFMCRCLAPVVALMQRGRSYLSKRCPRQSAQALPRGTQPPLVIVSVWRDCPAYLFSVECLDRFMPFRTSQQNAAQMQEGGDALGQVLEHSQKLAKRLMKQHAQVVPALFVKSDVVPGGTRHR
jgi:hypothetical protein